MSRHTLHSLYTYQIPIDMPEHTGNLLISTPMSDFSHAASFICAGLTTLEAACKSAAKRPKISQSCRNASLALRSMGHFVCYAAVITMSCCSYKSKQLLPSISTLWFSRFGGIRNQPLLWCAASLLALRANAVMYRNVDDVWIQVQGFLITRPSENDSAVEVLCMLLHCETI